MTIFQKLEKLIKILPSKHEQMRSIFLILILILIL
jgi:hypothetical protein